MAELNLDDLTAGKVRSYLKQRERQRKAAEAVAAEHAREEREQFRKKFKAEGVPADALQRVFSMVRGRWARERSHGAALLLTSCRTVAGV